MPVAEPRSPLALVALAMLAERPLHPYRMSQLMAERGKGSLANISQRNSLYQVIDRLVRDRLAEVDSTERSENRPERTVYRITELGRETVREWVLRSLDATRREFPAFPAGLSLIALLAPAEARDALSARRSMLADRRDGIAASVAQTLELGLPHLFLLDDQYAIRMLDAEVTWIDELLAEFASGELDWSQEWITEIAARFASPETD